MAQDVYYHAHALGTIESRVHKLNGVITEYFYPNSLAFSNVPDPVPDHLFWYKLDGNDNNLTRVGGDDFTVGPECNDNAGSLYNGSTQYENADVDSALIAVGTGPFSLSMWVATGSISAADSIGNGLGDTLDNTFRCSVTGGGALRIRLGGADKDTIGAYNDDAWHQFVVTSAGASGALLLYIDGSLEASLTASAYDLQDVGGLEVGSSTGNNSRWDGGLDGIRFYDRVLTPGEVTSLHEYTCGGFPFTFPIGL